MPVSRSGFPQLPGLEVVFSDSIQFIFNVINTDQHPLVAALWVFGSAL